LGQERTKSRRAAVQAIYQWQMTGGDMPSIEQQFLMLHDTNGMDVNYFHELIREIPLHVHELEDHYATLLDRPPSELDPVERAILRIGTYELEFRKDIPYRVVINESVELAKTFGAEDGYKYVNGVLDKVAVALRSSEIHNRKGPETSRSKSARKKP
jgi:transcription antitermination protein NusB